MAHLSEGTLRRMVDDPDAITSSDREHFATCETCKARHAAVADDAHQAEGLLAGPALTVDSAAAYRAVTAAPNAKPRFGFALPILLPAARPAYAGLIAAMLVVAMVVSAYATGVLNVFQPKTVEPVPISVADLQALSALADYGTLTWTTEPQPQIVVTAAEAEKVTGLHAPVVGQLPSGVSTNVTYGAIPKAVAVFTFDAAKAAAAAERSGKKLPALPAGMDGAKLTVTGGPAIFEVYGNLSATPTQSSSGSASDINLPQLIVAASTAPTVTSTQVTTQQLVNYLLSVPGISPELASTIKSLKDPSSTLLIPVPIQYATSTKVTVQGQQGVALGDNTGLGSAVIWIKGGIVYGVVATLKQSEVLTIANQLK